MTRVVIVGEIYNADLSIGGGPIYPPPRPPSGPVDPGYSPPWARPPVDPGWGVRPPVDPSWGVRPPVDPSWGVTPPVDPGWGVGLPGSGGTPVPPDLMPPPAVPEELASQVIVSVYDPKTTNWTTKSYPPRA